MIRLRSLLYEGNLSSISQIDNTVKAELCSAAQAAYDEWNQDEEGYDEEVGAGGICDIIADAMVDVLSNHNIWNVQTQYNEPHTYVIGKFKEGIFTIDIPYNTYETGYLYTWKKLPDVKFEPSHVDIYKLDPDHKRWKEYTAYD